MKHDKWQYDSWIIVVWLILVPIIMLCCYNEEVSGGFPMLFGGKFGEETPLVWKGILFAVVSFIIAVGLNPAFAIGRFCSKKGGLENGFLWGIVGFYLTVGAVVLFLICFREALIVLAVRLIGFYE